MSYTPLKIKQCLRDCWLIGWDAFDAWLYIDRCLELRTIVKLFTHWDVEAQQTQIPELPQ